MSAVMERWKLSGDTYVERAEAMLPMLRQYAPDSERTRSVHPDVVTAMKQAGFFRILQSSRLGGAELSMRDMHRVVRTLATGSSAASWILMVILAHIWILGMFPEDAQDEIAADDPDTLITGSLAPTARAVKADGGWRLTGRWPFASGCDHAKWNLLGVKVSGDDPSLPPAIHALAPVQDYAINDNWFTMGLKGTGSKELVLNDLFVPEHRVMPTSVLYGSLSPWGRRHPTWLHMMPVRAGPAYHVSAPVLGLAEQFFADFVRTTRVRDDKIYGIPQGRQPGLAVSDRGVRTRDSVGPAAVGSGRGRVRSVEHRAADCHRSGDDRPALQRELCGETVPERGRTSVRRGGGKCHI